MDEQHFSHEYRTGRTQPQHNNNRLITFLLICVIFLAGLVSVMGLLNIQLFHQLNRTQSSRPPISFTRGDMPYSTDYASGVTIGDITYTEISPLYRQVFGLPQGLYVCYVQSDSPAAQAGILPGDVLTHINGTPIAQLSLAEGLLGPEDVTLTLYRDGTIFSVCPGN